MKIPNHILDSIVAKNDIVSTVSEYVKIEKRGKNYFGLCPFHSEKTPSFSVSPEKQIFHCFSCGEGGNVLQFVSKIDNLSMLNTIKKLANKVNVKIDEFIDNNKDDEFLRYYDLNKFVSEYYQFALMNTIEGKKALDYLLGRNLTLDTIKRFKIGLAPDSVDSLYQALKSNNFTDIAILELGHVNKVNDRFYDKFKNRIMFPITDEEGNIIGFSGRIFLSEAKNEPKYINTQETPLFKKSYVLYNIDTAKKSIRQNNQVYLFEGFMDVIASVNSNLLESVATMGTALTDSHVEILKKYTQNITLCYDGDNAGIEATRRAIEILNKHHVNTSVIELPEGLDPDDYIKKYSGEKYLEFIKNNSLSLKDYLYKENKKNLNINNITSIENFKKYVFKLIQFSSPTEKEIFIGRLSQDLGISKETLNFDLSRFYKPNNRYIPNEQDVINQEAIYKKVEKSKPGEKKLRNAQEIILYMCFKDRDYCMLLANDQSVYLPTQNFRNLFHTLNDYYNLYPEFNNKEFEAKYLLNEDLLRFYREIYLNYLAEKMDQYNLESFKQCISTIKIHLISLSIQKIESQMRDPNLSLDEKIQLSQKINSQRTLKDEIFKTINNPK